MADDSDFTAPCREVDVLGNRCLVEAWWLYDVLQPHDHHFPAVSSDTLAIEKLRKIHSRIGRPSIASCTCGKIICPELDILEGIG